VNSRRIFVNALTFARVPLIFAWLALAVVEELRGGFWPGFWACACMLLAGLTDAFDGALARKWDVVSQLGKMADPLMDKVFYIVAFPVLLWLAGHSGAGEAHTLSLLALTVLYLLRDTWVTFMRSLGAMYGANVGAMWLGKVRTALSFPGAGWVYLYLSLRPFEPFGAGNAVADVVWQASVFAAEAVLAVLTVVSLFTYTRSYLPCIKMALEQK